MEATINIDPLETARFACPQCHREKTMQLSEYRIMKKTTRVKCRCRCGHVYTATLEKEPGIEKETRLLGTFITKGKHKFRGDMVIKRLNNRGILVKTDTSRSLSPGLTLFIEFVLDDVKQSIVKKEVIVTAKKGEYLSAEFTSGYHFDNLGPYLSFNNLYLKKDA